MIRLLSGDCRDVLPTLPAESVHTVVTSPPYYALRSYLDAEHSDKHREIGSESTPDEYLATMVGVFREVRRVLRRDGTCWVNMGDSYNNRTKVRTSSHQPSLNNFVDDNWAERAARGGVRMSINDGAIKEKDLLLMPARLALALQAQGWWVRSDIIIAKKNPMPESCRDRPTSAHEHVFLLTKAARYYFDPDAVREPSISNDPRRSYGRQGAWELDGRPAEYQDTVAKAGRNIRNVWDISTEAFSGAHFATMSTSVVERCIKAGTSERGCCSACGKPWVRVTDTAFVKLADRCSTRKAVQDGANMRDINSHNVMGYNDVTTTGWSPGCQCATTETRPCVVLDPFIGAGTTALVADRLQRDCIGIDLNTQYTTMAMERCQADAPLFTAFPPAEPPEDERMADLFTDMAAD